MIRRVPSCFPFMWYHTHCHSPHGVVFTFTWKMVHLIPTLSHLLVSWRAIIDQKLRTLVLYYSHNTKKNIHLKNTCTLPSTRDYFSREYEPNRSKKRKCTEGFLPKTSRPKKTALIDTSSFDIMQYTKTPL